MGSLYVGGPRVLDQKPGANDLSQPTTGVHSWLGSETRNHRRARVARKIAVAGRQQA